MRHSESIESVRSYYDALGENEWDRLTATVRGRVSLEVHRRFLRRFVRPGWRVPEVGAGPGRFTLELAALGTRIVVTDVSEVQLELNEARLGSTDAERGVERRERVARRSSLPSTTRSSEPASTSTEARRRMR